MEEKKPYRVYTDFSKEIQVSVSNPGSKEPALKVGAITSASVASVLGIVALIFPNLLDDKTTAVILLVSSIVLPIFTSLLSRPFVWSPSTVMDLARDVIKSVEDNGKPKSPKQLPF